MPDVQYQILRADVLGTPPVNEEIYNDPALAAADSKRLAKILGEKLMVKPIKNPAWKKREQKRFDDGTYRLVPWVNYDWWHHPYATAIHRNQFPHPALEKPGYLAYTKNDEEGTKDKQTIVKPGVYLEQYFLRVMDDHGIRQKHMVEVFAAEYGPIEVKFAKTEKEIISVYENGPDTCMKAKCWPGDGRNPAYIYAAGDLQVAYLGDLDDASARTLVWPEKKTYSRVYGDIARITQGLNKLGYKWGAPIGAKVKKVEVKKVKFDPNRGPPSGCFITPYIDKLNQRGGGHLSVIDKGNHLEICEEGRPGSHHCGLPDGYSGLYVPREDEFPTFTCDCCGKAGHRQLLNVFVTDEADDEEAWCDRCARYKSFVCGYSGERFAIDSVNHTMVYDAPWNSRYADMYAAKCEHTGKLFNERDLILIHDLDGSKKRINRYTLEHIGGFTKSGVSGRFYLRRNTIGVFCNYSGGRQLGKNELSKHTFQCDGCDNYQMLNDREQPFGDDRLFCMNCIRYVQAGRPAPVSPLRRAFEQKRDQLELIAAE